MHRLRGEKLVEVLDFIRLPKILLHEHLDGGVRPKTVIDLAKDLGYAGLQTTDTLELAQWFHRGAQRGNLPEYLEGFAHTIGVMQGKEALERVAYEFLEDMALDGVMYTEVRFAPMFHVSDTLTADEVVESVIAGLTKAEKDHGVEWGLIICAMRDKDGSLDAAELAIRHRDKGNGVVGFDLAGGEAGFPPKKHIEAFQAIQRANFNITIHAGEAYGMNSIWQAVQWCGAHRLGHGTRLLDDVSFNGEDIILGSLARHILDHRIPLEMCLSSNLHTGACESLEKHPFGLFFEMGFRVSLNTDDRLMSDTEMSKEISLATNLFELSLNDLEKIAMNSMKSAFTPHEERIRIMHSKILPGFLKLKAELQNYV